MIEWNDNAKAAVRAFADYIGQTKKCHRYLESFASKKTIADAVEWSKKEYGNSHWRFEESDIILYHPVHGIFYSKSEYPLEDGSYAICTREQFEAYVKEQEGEKWTHITPLGSKCKVLAVDGEHSWVLTEHGSRTTEFASSLKPIKPTIKPSAAWSLVSKQGWPIHQVTETYDVEEVPVND